MLSFGILNKKSFLKPKFKIISKKLMGLLPKYPLAKPWLNLGKERSGFGVVINIDIVGN